MALRIFYLFISNFITFLPKTQKGHDAILVFVDRLTKVVHFIPTHTDVSAEDVTRLVLEHVILLHGRLEDVVFERDTEFASLF